MDREGHSHDRIKAPKGGEIMAISLALAKTLPLECGYDAAYWRILSAGVDYLNRIVTVNYAAFKDSTAFDDSNGSASLIKRTLKIEGDDFATYFETSDTLSAQLQAALMARDPDLSDATVI